MLEVFLEEKLGSQYSSVFSIGNSFEIPHLSFVFRENLIKNIKKFLWVRVARDEDG